jgi:rRNA small subunit pseudouridine methyltransferase Nep1
MIDLFKKKVINSANTADSDDDDNNNKNNILLQLHDGITFEKVIKEIIKPAKSIGLSTVGLQSTAHAVVTNNISEENADCTFVIGGFPKGHFSSNTSALLNRLYSISEYSLEAHVVIARILYECENNLQK